MTAKCERKMNKEGESVSSGFIVAAAPFAFLIVSLIVLIFGAGRISMDSALAFFYGSTRVKQAKSVTA
jgi:hypothetical protein